MTKHPAASIIILVSNGATRTTKVRAAPFVLSEIAKVLQNLAKAQRGADRIFSDSLKEKAAMPQSENYLLKGAVINGFLIHANSCCRVGRQNSGNR